MKITSHINGLVAPIIWPRRDTPRELKALAGLGEGSRQSWRLNVDAAVAKRFKLNGIIQAEARIEALNLFNHPNFIRVNSIYGEGPAPLRTFLAPIAGITRSDPSRQFQVMLRLHF